jgi:type II secretory pathway component PulF
MAQYRYKAIDRSGKTVTGVIEAPTELGAMTLLDKMGYTPITLAIAARKKLKLKDRLIRRGGGIKVSALVTFTRQFATLVKAAIPIATGLQILSSQTEVEALRRVLLIITRDIEGGISLSQAMGKHPQIFSELYVNTVIAGESSGTLDTVLMRLADMLYRDYETYQEVKQAMRYPLMVVVALAVAITILVVFVVPKFADVYSRFGAELPLPTRILMLTSNIMRKWWYIMIMVCVGVFQGVKQILKIRAVWLFVDAFKLRIKVFGPLNQKMAMCRFSTMMATLNASGLPILRTVEIIGSTIGNEVLTREMDLLKRGIAEGKGISGFMKESKLFPPLVSNMLAIGEQSGMLNEMCSFVAEYYEMEVKHMVKNLTSIIEPLLTLVLGSVVLGLALAIFLPMWNLIAVFQQGAIK